MKKVIISISIILIVFILSIFLFINYSLKSVSKESEEVSFTIKSGMSAKKIVKELSDANLIRNSFVAEVYMRLKTDSNFMAATYNLNRNMTVPEIFKTLAKGGRPDQMVHLTFVEGLTLKEYLKQISEAFALDYEQILKEVNEEEFLKPLIDKYWFLDNDLLDKDVYYYLEGYLFPNTYEFYANSSLKTIMTKLLDETGKKLEPLKEEIEESNKSVHDILTMASIIEKEAISDDDRAKVSQVIRTRIAKNMNLGMDVTTYYGVQKSLKEALTKQDLSNDNPYNTRNEKLKGLSIGPICNASLASIKAALEPADTNYIYFYADIKTGQIHFTDSYQEFLTFKEIYK